MVTLSTVFRWPLWGILFLSRIFVSWRTLFVIYPGDLSDIKAYSPDSLIWLRDTWLFRSKPQFAGIQIRKGGKGTEAYWGIVVYISSTTDELRRDKQLVLNIMQRLRFICRLLGIQIIACAGQIPGIMSKHNIEIEKPFIDGRLGSSFSVISTVNKTYEIHNIQKDQKLLVIVGIGFLGKTVIENLQTSGYRVQGIDIVTTKAGVHIGDSAVKTLSKADVVVVLTPRGQDFVPYQKHLKPGAIIIDDTHPRLRQQIEKNPMYKVALEWPGFEFIPRLPGYKKQWIPGCMIEAIVKSYSKQWCSSYQNFSKTAQHIGIGVLIEQVKKT
jgi:hypothetical protein